MIDCGFQKDNAWFRYRAGAIIVHEDKMLFVKCKFAIAPLSEIHYRQIQGGTKDEDH